MSRISCDPARVACLNAGSLSVGSTADVCIFDPDHRWTVNANTITSQGKHTPFIGYELQGRVSHTIVSGRLAFSRSA